MSDLKKLIKTNIDNLFNEEKYFGDMEVTFTGKELSDKEKEQFDDMEEVGIEKNGKTLPNSKHNGEKEVEKASKETGKDSVAYYKDTAKKMKKFQTPDENQQQQSRIGEAESKKKFKEPKVDREMSDAEAYETEVYGAGMQGLKYDDEGSEKHDEFEERNDETMKGDPTYDKLKKNGKKYRDHKYNKPDEYHNSPKVRTTKENKDMGYIDVVKENIFKANGKLMTEEQVLKIANKVPSRVKVDESVFAITDGDNYYRILWEGAEDGEPTITHSKNTNTVNESISDMKAMWEFNPNDSISTKKNITESVDDAFKRMYTRMRDSDGLVDGERK